MRAAGKGLAIFLCKKHSQHRQRHGSAWHGTYGAEEREPYENAAAAWLQQHSERPMVIYARGRLDGLLATAGRALDATELRGLKPAARARAALARLREASIKPDRLLAIHLAISALIKEAPMSPDDKEFRLVQVAKVAHRLASGFHRTWDFPLPNGETAPVAMHKYARSTGRVLRHLGARIETCCEHLMRDHLTEFLAWKIERFGKHPFLVDPFNATHTVAGRLRFPNGVPGRPRSAA